MLADYDVLRQWLIDAQAAHSEWEKANGTDPDWALWYARYLNERAAQQRRVLARRKGWRVAENVNANVGFYVRPDDQFSFSPGKVYPSATEAWAAFDREAS